MKLCIDNYVNLLKNDEVIAFPTDTVWGLSASSFSQKAIDNLIKIKQRKPDKSFSVLVSSITELIKYAILSDFEKLLIKKLWPGSFSILLQAKDLNWAKSLNSKDNSVAFRCIDHLFTNQLLSKWDAPLITSSANISGHTLCHNADSILKINKHIKIDSYFLNFSDKLHSPSTLIKVVDKKIKILRKSYQYNLLEQISKQESWDLIF